MDLIAFLWGLTIAAAISALVDYYAFDRMMTTEGLYEI